MQSFLTDAFALVNGMSAGTVTLSQLDNFFDRYGADVNFEYDFSTLGGTTTTFLVHSVDTSRIEIARHLLDKYQANVAQQHNAMGKTTALHRACYNGNVAAVKLLMEFTDSSSATLLDSSHHRCFDLFAPHVPVAVQNDIRVLCCGVITGAAETLAPVIQKAALEAVMNPDQCAELERLLRDHPGLANYAIELPDDDFTNLLYAAARSNNVAAVGLLLRFGAVVDQVCRSGSTALHVCCYRGHLDCVERLLQHDPRPRTDIRNSYNELCDDVFREDVPLQLQSTIRQLVRFDSIKLRVAFLNDDVRSFAAAFAGSPDSMLREAVLENCTQIVKYLLSNGAQRDAVNEALFTAVETWKVPMAELLLLFGADLSILLAAAERDPIIESVFQGLLPLMPLVDQVVAVVQNAPLPQRRVSTDPIKEWITTSAQNLSPDYKIATPQGEVPLLWYASFVGNCDVITRLAREFNSSITARDADRLDTPLHVAARNGHTECVEALLSFQSCALLVNNAGKRAGDEGFASNVTESTQTSIQNILKAARAAEHEEALRGNNDRYISSLVRREIPGCPATKAEMLASQPNLALSPSTPAIRALLARLLAEAAVEKVSDGLAANPLRQRYCNELFVAATSLANSEVEKFDFGSVAEPLVFKENQLNDFCRRALRDAATSFEAFLTASLPTSVDFSTLLTLPPLTMCDELYRKIVSMVRVSLDKWRKDERAKRSVGIVTSTFITSLLTHLESDLKIGNGFFDASGPLAVLTRAEHVFTLPQMLSRVTSFVSALATEWHNDANYRDVAVTVLGLLPTPSARQMLDAVDLALAKHMTSQISFATATYVKGVNSSNSTNSTAQHFIKRCEDAAIAAAEADVLANETLLGPSKSALFGTKDYFDPLVIATYFRDPATLRSALKKVTDDNLASLWSAGSATGTRYSTEIRKLFDKIVDSSPLDRILDGVVRRVHLNTVWSHMAAYEKLDEVRTALQASQIVLLEADTGSGKSVLIPQFIAEELSFRTTVTQPRREAALNTGNHVALQFGKHAVGCQVAGVRNSCPNGMLQYNTDMFFLGKAFGAGVPELQNACIVIDEVHERLPSMDMLYLCLLEKMRAIATPRFKIVLASATVDKQWFEDTARQFGFTFSHVRLTVQTPFGVTVTRIQHPQIQNGGVADPGNAAKREGIAAKKALAIVKRDSNAKVIAFLPHKTELDAANLEFQVLCGGQVESHAVHANTSNVHAKLQTGRVFFSNNVLETTFTVPGLTHVLDFNHAIVVDIDAERNTRELKIEFSTQSSQQQRKGRLGRVQQGEYFHYYDISQLPMSAPISFDQLPNDTFLQFEARCRYFLKRSLCAGQPGYPALGLGVRPRPPWVMNMIPSDATDNKIVAMLNLPGGFARAFLHALKKNTCPLAILWLETMMECRTPCTPPGVSLPTRFANVGLGCNGDFGILLEVFGEYLDAKQLSPNFDIVTHCRRDNTNPHFLENVESRMEDVERIVAELQLSYSSWKRKKDWTWAEIEEALLMGFSNQVVKLVSTSLQDGTYRSNDFQGPYRTLESNQMHALSLFGNSAWVTAGPNPMPEYLLFYALETIRGRSFVRLVCGVSTQAVEGVLPTDHVQQSIGVVYRDRQAHRQLFPNKVYPHCTLREKSSQDPSPFTAEIGVRWGPRALPNLHTEFVVSGTRLQVATTMDAIALDISAARAHQKQLVAMAAASNQTLNATFNGPGPSATLADIKVIDPQMALRLEKATSNSRNDSVLAAAIQGTDKVEQGLALCNVLLNRFGFIVKGGFVRDVVVRGLGTYKDFDIELPATYTQQNWKNMIHQLTQDFRTKYGVVCQAPVASNFHGPDTMIRVFVGVPVQVELECVSPWNTTYIPCKNMDFSVNNLRLKPNDVALHQQIGFGMTVQQIVGQLRNSPALASPLYDVRWIAGSGTNSGEGMSRTMWCEHTPATSPMKSRLPWARTKKFILVEAPFHGSTSGEGTTVILYHGTSPAAAQSILQSNFNPSTSGNLGAGVYMSRDMTIVNMFAKGGAKGNILVATVDLKRKYNARGFDSTGASWAGYDSCYLDQSFSPRNLEEWCIRNPQQQISHIRLYN